MIPREPSFCVYVVVVFCFFFLHHKLSRDMTKPTKSVCDQRRLRSAWASAQSDQSLPCPHEKSLGPELPNECTVKILIRLGGRWAHTHFVGFVMSRLKSSEQSTKMRDE